MGELPAGGRVRAEAVLAGDRVLPEGPTGETGSGPGAELPLHVWRGHRAGQCGRTLLDRSSPEKHSGSWGLVGCLSRPAQSDGPGGLHPQSGVAGAGGQGAWGSQAAPPPPPPRRVALLWLVGGVRSDAGGERSASELQTATVPILPLLHLLSPAMPTWCCQTGPGGVRGQLLESVEIARRMTDSQIKNSVCVGEDDQIVSSFFLMMLPNVTFI